MCGSRRQAGRRGSGRVTTSTRGRSRGCRARRGRRALQAPAAATGKGGRAEEAEKRRRRGDGGMFPQDRGHQGGEGTGLEPLTDPPQIAVPSSFLTALPRCSRTEPRASCPRSLLLWAGLGVLSCRVCFVYVRRVAVPCFWELSLESSPGPRRGHSLVLSRPFGDGQEGGSNFIPLCDFLRVWALGKAPLRWMLHCFWRQAPSARSLKVPLPGWFPNLFPRA